MRSIVPLFLILKKTVIQGNFLIAHIDLIPSNQGIVTNKTVDEGNESGGRVPRNS